MGTNVILVLELVSEGYEKCGLNYLDGKIKLYQ